MVQMRRGIPNKKKKEENRRRRERCSCSVWLDDGGLSDDIFSVA